VDPGGEAYVINWNAAADSSSSTMVLSYWNAADSYFNFNNAGQKNFNYWPRPMPSM
jgi:hypothetical protein